jgi:hypothetical protein
MSSMTSVSFSCSPEQIRIAYKKAFGISVTVPASGNSDVVVGLINTLLGVVDVKVADPSYTAAYPKGIAWNDQSGLWGITIFAGSGNVLNGRLLGEEVARLQALMDGV